MREIFSEVQALFSRDGRFARWLRAEAALANAQAALGLLPQKAAADISAAAQVEKKDLANFFRQGEIFQKAPLHTDFVSLPRVFPCNAGSIH